MRLLGIDFGSKRVGTAVSDEAGEFAMPLTVFQNNNDLLSALKKIIAEKHIGAIVLGESKNFKGEDNVIMKAIMKFKAALEKGTGLPAFLEPEFLTSVQAARWQGKVEKLDASAAAIILQSYLDRRQ